MSLVWDSTVPAPERFTLLALADRADEEGVCWPSVPTLARKCATGERTIQRHLATLQSLGVIEVERRLGHRSLYRIDLDALRAAAQECSTTPPHPRQSDTPVNLTPRQIDTRTPVNLSKNPRQSDTQYISDAPVDPSGGPRKRGTRIPDDFTATDEMITWAREHTPLVGRDETEQFKDYWQAASGPNATKRDWRKAWQVWMRRAQRDAERRPAHLRPVPVSRPSDPVAALDDLRRRGAALEASRLIAPNWIEPSQPPSDPTPPREWLHARRVEFIDAHADAIRAALSQRETG